VGSIHAAGVSRELRLIDDELRSVIPWGELGRR